MPKCLVKLGSKYVEYSTIVDAPVTAPMTRVEMAQYLRDEYGRSEEHATEERLARCDAKGTSSLLEPSAESAVACNRFGPGESEMSYSELIAWANGSSNAFDE